MFFQKLAATASSAAETASEAASEAATEAATAAAAAGGIATALSGEIGGVGNWPIIGWIAILFGFIMRGIYLVFAAMNIYSITLCIVVFTVVTKMLLLPLTIRQQKFTKVQALMQPEITALQKKYQGRRDQASMAKMQAEQQQIYDKYGSSMAAGCLPSLIQLPFLFALYPVIMYFSGYVPEILKESTEVQTSFFMLGNIDLQISPWTSTSFSSISAFFGNLAWLIPLLAGGFQFLSTKLMQPKNQPQRSDAPGGNSMKMMTYFMPIFTVYIGFTLPAFLGVYWVVQSLVMLIQQYVINKRMDKIPIEDIIKANIEKRNKKRARRGLPPINEKAAMNTRKIDAEKAEKTEEQLRERDEKIKASTDYYRSRSAAPGSLAAKANMVRDYNEKHDKKSK